MELLKRSYLLLCLSIAVALGACERPGAPDFKTEHKLSVPLTVDKTYPFLGNRDALLDTTDEDMSDLLSADHDGLVRLSKQELFNFTSLDDAIPQVEIDATNATANVGEIELNNFSSGKAGSMEFEDVTGYPEFLGEGEPILGGASGPVSIDNFDPDYFQSAVIKETGNLQITLVNSLGFDINNHFSVTLLSNGVAVGSDQTNILSHGETKIFTISIPSGTILSNIGVEIEAEWEEQKMEADAGPMTVEDVSGSELIAEEVTAAIESQLLKDTGSAEMDKTDFEFSDEEDYIAIKSGKITIEIFNRIDLGVEPIEIEFPSITDMQGMPLTITETIPREKELYDRHTITKDLSGHMIKAACGCLNYSISGQTENLQNSNEDNYRTVQEDDDLHARVFIENLQISKAQGIIKPKRVLLNTDVNNDGNVDLFDDREAELIDIEGFEDISRKLSGLNFVNPSLSTIYKSNLGIPTTIYAAIAGINADGKPVYLTGDSGSEYHVESSDLPNELKSQGQSLTESQVIRFELTDLPSENGASVNFDTSKTNSSEFFSNLPNRIRFVGVAKVGDMEQAGTITDPVTFEPSMGVDIPFNFAADQASFKDTVDADLGDLPKEKENRKLSGATLSVNYENGLPFELGMRLIMLDTEGRKLMRYPDSDGKREIMGSGEINEDAFVESKHQDKFQISFTEEQLKHLHKTRHMVLEINFDTSQKKEVKVRAADEISLGLKLNVDATSTVN